MGSKYLLRYEEGLDIHVSLGRQPVAQARAHRVPPCQWQISEKVHLKLDSRVIVRHNTS